MIRTCSSLKKGAGPLSRRRFILATLLAVSAAVPALPIHAGEPGPPLPWRVGIAKADITPPLEVGILMSSGRRLWQPFEGVRMPLEARALVLQRDNVRLAVVSLDLLGLGDEAVGGMRQFKQRMAADAGRMVEADRIVLCCTHTHSAPSSAGCTDLIHTEPFKAWVGDLSRQIGSAIKDAAGSARPCRLMVGAESAPGHTVNRRIKTKQGIRSYRTTMDPDIVIGPEGPTDELVNVAAFMDGSNRPVAMVVNAPCHPVHEMCIPQVSPDFPGEMVRELDRRHAGCVAMFLNGSAGNMNPPQVSGGADDARKHGLLLADTVDRALGKLLPVKGNGLAISWREIEMPGRDPKGQPLEEPLRTRLAAIRLGNAVCCLLPGESFIETSLAIREASPWDFTMVVGYAEEWIGYIPTDQAFDNGGYETNPGASSKLRRGSEGILRRQAIDLVGCLGEDR
jgi:neutral/alkaline ceramidase-like enzyme